MTRVKFLLPSSKVQASFFKLTTLSLIILPPIIWVINKLKKLSSPLFAWNSSVDDNIYIFEKYVIIVVVISWLTTIIVIYLRNSRYGELLPLFRGSIIKEWFEVYGLKLEDRSGQTVYPKIIQTPDGFAISTLAVFRQQLLRANDSLNDLLSLRKAKVKVIESYSKDGYVHYRVGNDVSTDRIKG